MALPAAHFRAHDRRAVRLAAELIDPRSGGGKTATIVNLSLAGAGIETEEALLAGDRLALAVATPTTWDPLRIDVVVAWAHPPRPGAGVDTFGRSKAVARGGVVFDYEAPAAVLAMFAMLASLGYE